MVDVGANFGEIALWFVCEYPGARVLAIEPSSANVKVLKRNVAAQSFATGNLEIAHTAVGEKSGFAALTKGAGQMARVVADDESGTERVPCERLDTLFSRYEIDRADFVKIDIEGSEPGLMGAIAALAGRVRSYYIEFSQFAPMQRYLALAELLLKNDFACYDEPAERRFGGTDELEPHLRRAFAAGPIAATNLWFFAR
jgi:FkbM family methyltransferase